MRYIRSVISDGLEVAARFRQLDLSVQPKEEQIEERNLGDMLNSDEDVVINHTMSEYVERLIYINRQPFSFKGREYLRSIYDGLPQHPKARKIVLVAGRQVEKSSTLAALTLTRLAIRPFSSALVVEPRLDQVRVFSHQRLRLMAEDSPPLMKLWIGSDCQWQVGVRELRNRAVCYLRSCYYSADPLRGITAGDVYIDEAQDIISDNIPVIEECQSHVPEADRLNIYSGTPNTTSNTHWKQYTESCQFEYMVKCQACNHYNYLDEKVIGKHSYICSRCGKPLFIAAHGVWVAMKPSRLDTMLGYRIPQIMVPFMSHASVLAKMEDPNRPRRVFVNEVLGLPYDAGQLVLTEADVRARCEDRAQDNPVTVTQRKILHLCAGLDHGTGGYTPLGMGTGRTIGRSRSAEHTSFTVLAHGGFCEDGKFRIVNIFKFVGEMSNLANQPGLVNEIVRDWGTKWIMSDAGFGGQTNSRLVNEFGWTRNHIPGQPMIMECEYVYSRRLARFDPRAYRYVVDRNFVIDLFVSAIKRGDVRFFRQEDMEAFMMDFVTLYAEYSATTNRIRYDHTLPDDCFHACLYCFLAAMQYAGRLVPTGVAYLT